RCFSDPRGRDWSGRFCAFGTRPSRGSARFPYTTLFRSFGTTGAQDSTGSGANPPVTDREFAARIRYLKEPAARGAWPSRGSTRRSEEHTSELQSRENLVCRLLLEKNKTSLPSRVTSLTS